MSEDNIDGALLQQQTNTLFTSGDHSPVQFFIPAGEEHREKLVSLVTEHGGSVTEDAARGLYISKFADAHRDVVDPKFITESVDKKRLLDSGDYKVLTFDESNNETGHALTTFLETGNADADTSAGAGAGTGATAGTVANANTNANDDVAAEVNATLEDPSGNTDSDRQARLVAASSVPESEYVTKSDRINLHNKNGFTAQEDQMILEEVRRNPQRRSTHKLFHEIADKIGRHTGNSIRYRFRTHLQNSLLYVYKTAPDGTLLTDEKGDLIRSTEMPGTLKTKFTAKDDYILATEVKKNISSRDDFNTEDSRDLILPGQFFETLFRNYPNHTKAAWRDRYRKFLVPNGVEKYITYYEVEQQEGRDPVELKNFTGKHLYKSSKKKQSNAGEDLDTVVGVSLLRHNNELGNDGTTSQGNANKRRRTGEDNNLFMHADQTELDNINFDSQTAAAAMAAASTDPTSLHPDIDNRLTGDLIDKRFNEFQPLLSVVDKIREIVERSYDTGDAQQLIDALYEECGIQKRFGMFIIASVCGDMVLIPTFVETFLKTGENPPANTHGIWTPRDDKLLKDADSNGDKKALEFITKLHGEKRVALRRKFIAADYV